MKKNFDQECQSGFRVSSFGSRVRSWKEKVEGVLCVVGRVIRVRVRKPISSNNLIPPRRWIRVVAVICGLVLLSALICAPSYAAGLEISVSPVEPWALGILSPNTEQTSDQWTVTASSDGTEDISVKVSDAQGWTAGGASNGASTYGLKTNVSPIVAITGTDTLWKDDAAIGDHSFGLWFKAPSSQTAGQKGEHTLTVTLTATDWYDQTALTWEGSTHTQGDCTADGGTVFDTGATGTICKFPTATVPSGWTQADHWQEYSSSEWGGDACGRHLSTGPSTFSNTASTCRNDPGVGANLGDCTKYVNLWHHSTSQYRGQVPAEENDCATNRVAVGGY